MPLSGRNGTKSNGNRGEDWHVSTPHADQRIQRLTYKDDLQWPHTYNIFTGNAEYKYYISVQSLNAKKAGPDAYCQVAVNPFEPADVNIKGALSPFEGADTCALAMPETDGLAASSDSSLNLTDALSIGQYDADVLADASASSLAGLDDKAGWLNIVSLV